MAERDLGRVLHLFAEAIGQPGRRRFRLQVIGETGDSASVWLEKEQLAAVGDAIENVLRDVGYQYQRLPLDDAEMPMVFPYAPDVDFRAAELSMGLDRDLQRIVLTTSSPAGDSLTFGCDFRKAHELRGQIVDVVAAGRPTCLLCTGPIDPDGHICVKRNGHHPQP